ncbi:16S rRNA (guanine(966)-N(2))-methyltransferase RsmD [Rhodovarius crocodyli]|uniref:16S rRNA (Guanine(966)-N(2))-methyltransferase RsmD n=1 Tax=Rhodovarius crocodyli TaxID=1979269 RepID=A0A437LZ83_9PROT|nr:16S rRNA (guanine(966)-N(2))-methyltransferase RsmD [Rhodovarius crocodyli]
MRIVAGAHRGRNLTAPLGEQTRPTADRARQALFDMLMHAPWAETHAVREARVLDAFAGSGALGLEALSRGAAHATFMETARPALAAIRANVVACREEARAAILPADATRPPKPPAACSLIFLDPPYRQALLPRALAGLGRAGWIAPGAVCCLEMARDEEFETDWPVLADRAHGAARMLVLRAPSDAA